MIDITNEDCIELLKRSKDNEYDLAIVDVPYGIGFSDYERGGKVSQKTKKRHTKNGKKNWDAEIPKDEYWIELFRVSKEVIAWGVIIYRFYGKRAVKVLFIGTRAIQYLIFLMENLRGLLLIDLPFNSITDTMEI